MKNLIKFSLIAMFALNLNANNNDAGLSQAQMDEIRAIMKQTQELANEQQGMGESIFNDKEKDINKNIRSNFKINPLGMRGKETQPNIESFHNSQDSFNANMEVIDFSKEELELMQGAMRNQDLKALQKKFHSKKYSGYENTKTIPYTPNKTHKIRTRQAMATTLIFESDIDNFILGDQKGFKIAQIPSKANAIAIIPQLIGIDTSLTIFTNDGKIHTFYLFSTDYKNVNDPSFVIKIEDEEAKKIKLAKQEAINKEYKIIKDGIAEVKVKKSDIYSGYTQKAKEENEWLLSAEIFDDKKFTYFKYSKDEMPQIPAIFAVIDKQDSPVETRIVGDYIIAETTNPKFTIKSGNSYVCVNRQPKQAEIQRREERKNLNIENKKETIKNNNKTIKNKKEKQEHEAVKKLRGI